MSPKAANDGYTRGARLFDVKSMLMAARINAPADAVAALPALMKRLEHLTTAELLEALVEAKRAGMI